ncbi:MATE family efflux transporter [Anaeromicropila populeti]|uniref:Probable multidrug resistance protein NorM n=1 Tax=Anaeromicropila populeti TaxID=37658 RepID=A0A1I6IFK0_9FIRM|nr:MATE family efflux transporter [Anaeromicropila populeti]SFR65522.1 multidrug resistance protein, MATE family [Anaeromicropila populeti]
MNEEEPLSKRGFLKKAVPNIMASISIPLLGMADIAVIGNLNNADFIAGVSVGTQILETLYWVFGNIRYIASGQSAQSLGTGNPKERLNALLQPLAFAIIIFAALVLFRNQIFSLFLLFIQPEAGVTRAASLYYNILIFASFFVLADYIIRGWMLGQGKTVLCMFIQVGCTLLNIVLDLVFVNVLHAGIAGVAWATFIAQLTAILIEIIYLTVFGKFKRIDFDRELILNRNNIFAYLKLNSDFFLRTLFHTTVRNGFLAYGSRLGTVILAANGIISQINAITIYALEALGNTSTYYAGKYWGSKDKKSLQKLWRIAIQTGVSMALFLAVCFEIFCIPVFHLYTNISEVLALLVEYRIWIFICPVASCIMDVLTGFYSGCTYIKPIRNGAFLAMACFFLSGTILIPYIGNHGLWVSQCIYWVVTASVLLFSYKKVLQGW